MNVSKLSHFRMSLILAGAFFLLLLFSSCCLLEQKKQKSFDFEEIIKNAKSQVFPALVFVKPIREEYSSGEKTQMEVLGSGVIISQDGYVVTNNHVVEKAIQINCVLFDREQYPAEIIGTDPETDLALLKLIPEPAGNRFNSSGDDSFTTPIFPVAEFGDSDKLTEGQFVMALGSPYGFTRSISLGVVSNMQRYLGFKTQYKYNTWIQTDAAINPGNSGGPLVNTEGKIIGINTLGLSGLAEGVGFSIPSNIVKKITDRLKCDGKVNRAWTGLSLQALQDFHSNTFTQAERGVLIRNVESGSPAQEAGIRAGDILVAINGEMLGGGAFVEELPDIRWKLADLPIGQDADLTIDRGDDTIHFIMKTREKGKFEGEDFDCHRWNFTVKEISKFSTPGLYYQKKEGVYIQGVRYPGNAMSAGLQKKDIIRSIDNKEMKTLEDMKMVYKSIMEDEDREKKFVIKVLRKNYPRIFVLDYRFNYNEEE